MHMSSPIASQYILHSSQIKYSIFCYLFLLASHVPLCHNLFCPLVPLPFPLRSPCTVTNLVFSGDYTRLIQQQAYTTCFVRGSKVLLVSALKELVSVCITTDEHTLHYKISVCGVSHNLPLSAQLLKTVSLTYRSVGYRSVTCFPESRFPFLSLLGFLFLWASLSLRNVQINN